MSSAKLGHCGSENSGHFRGQKALVSWQYYYNSSEPTDHRIVCSRLSHFLSHAGSKVLYNKTQIYGTDLTPMGFGVQLMEREFARVPPTSPSLWAAPRLFRQPGCSVRYNIS